MAVERRRSAQQQQQQARDRPQLELLLLASPPHTSIAAEAWTASTALLLLPLPL